jgi:hypothetical protein
VEFDKGMCWIRNKDGMVVGTGRKHHRLYLLAARAILTKEKANLATTGKHTWDQWHRRYGHISVTTLCQLEKEGLGKWSRYRPIFDPITVMCRLHPGQAGAPSIPTRSREPFKDPRRACNFRRLGTCQGNIDRRLEILHLLQRRLCQACHCAIFTWERGSPTSDQGTRC